MVAEARLGVNSVACPLDRLHFRVSPQEWGRIVDEFRVGAFGQHSCATKPFILGCLFHVSSLDIFPEDKGGAAAAEAAEREGMIVAMAVAEIQRRIDVLQDGAESREMASELVVSIERTLRQGELAAQGGGVCLCLFIICAKGCCYWGEGIVERSVALSVGLFFSLLKMCCVVGYRSERVLRWFNVDVESIRLRFLLLFWVIDGDHVIGNGLDVA